jgi:hypothetical protein
LLSPTLVKFVILSLVAHESLLGTLSNSPQNRHTIHRLLRPIPMFMSCPTIMHQSFLILECNTLFIVDPLDLPHIRYTHV